ncbi:sigma-70 family RNA polymerase sigma factor [Sorangium sp. So ce327]|jgi:RNA polymerase sigma factor for flagellar operon FliA|uniref:sigma-70 family RNA polymerase sigma factor n=1 Tax=Sorangium sp. So ce327 TaxID=3133301 RepID=UPI003F619E76
MSLSACCDGGGFVQPVAFGATCPVVPCEHALIEGPSALGLDGSPSVAVQEPGASLSREVWESAEAASRCAHEIWESVEVTSACTYEGPWQLLEPDGEPDIEPDGGPCSPPRCTEAACTGGSRDHEPTCAPLRPEVLQGYFPLVRKLVRQVSRHLPPNVQRDDLLSAGMLGLVDSLRKNGGSDGETFAGYAKLRIRGAIVDELRAQDWLSRRAREAVEAEAASRASGATVFVSLSEVTPTEESVHMSGEDDPIEAISAQATRRALSFAIAQLPERERRVIGMYYFEGAKLKDIGAELGIGEPRVSQLHTRALGMLRGMLSHA